MITNLPTVFVLVLAAKEFLIFPDKAFLPQHPHPAASVHSRCHHSGGEFRGGIGEIHGFYSVQVYNNMIAMDRISRSFQSPTFKAFLPGH
jgi:hypothetical protein